MLTAQSTCFPAVSSHVRIVAIPPVSLAIPRMVSIATYYVPVGGVAKNNILINRSNDIIIIIIKKLYHEYYLYLGCYDMITIFHLDNAFGNTFSSASNFLCKVFLHILLVS